MAHNAHVNVPDDALRPEVEVRGGIDIETVPTGSNHSRCAIFVVHQNESPSPQVDMSYNLRMPGLGDDVEGKPLARLDLQDPLVKCDSSRKPAPPIGADAVAICR